MTSLNPSLRLALINKAKSKKNILQKGFTLVELMTVIVIVGILSAVALPNFLNQGKKAAATEARQQVSSIFKQAHAYVLEKGGLGTVDTTCEDYAGTITAIADGASFSYECGGTANAFTVTATGDPANKNTETTEVVLTGDLEDGTSETVVDTEVSAG